MSEQEQAGVNHGQKLLGNGVDPNIGVDHHFMPGQSGNPKGRPKGTHNVSWHIKKLLNDPGFIEILPGAEKAHPKYQSTPMKAILATLMAKAITGDLKAADPLYKYGYGTRVDVTSNGERIVSNPVVISPIAPARQAVRWTVMQKPRCEMLQLKTEQAEAVAAVNDPLVDTLVLIGAVGTGKTDVAAHIVLSLCYQFPKTRWPVFRQNQTTAADTVIPSYLDMAERMGLIQGEDFIYTQKPYRITFPNGSVIPFREADPTKDRGGKNVKGMNATGNTSMRPTSSSSKCSCRPHLARLGTTSRVSPRSRSSR